MKQYKSDGSAKTHICIQEPSWFPSAASCLCNHQYIYKRNSRKIKKLTGACLNFKHCECSGSSEHSWPHGAQFFCFLINIWRLWQKLDTQFDEERFEEVLHSTFSSGICSTHCYDLLLTVFITIMLMPCLGKLMTDFLGTNLSYLTICAKEPQMIYPDYHK